MWIISRPMSYLNVALVFFIVGFGFGVEAARPAHSETISPGDLMYTDFYLWPNWRENWALYDCTSKMTYFMTNPPPVELTPPPVELTPPPIELTPPVIVPPPHWSEIPDPCGDCSTPAVPAIPEAPTWLMMVISFIALFWLATRRREGFMACSHCHHYREGFSCCHCDEDPS